MLLFSCTIQSEKFHSALFLSSSRSLCCWWPSVDNGLENVYAPKFLCYAQVHVLFVWIFSLDLIEPIRRSSAHHQTRNNSIKREISETLRFQHFSNSFCRLEELRIDHNQLGALPNTLKLLRNLKSISVSNNKIVTLPDFMIAMRFNNSIVSRI